jgi:hypothetical protein
MAEKRKACGLLARNPEKEWASEKIQMSMEE